MGMNALEVRRRVMMAQPHEAVASGAVASFRTDVVSALPMEFDLTPVQDLHGQANPYPPGGGVNKWDEVWASSLTIGSYGNNFGSVNFVPVIPGETYYFVTGAYSIGSKGLRLAYYDANKELTSSTVVYSSSVTIPSGCYFIKFGIQQSVYGTTYLNDISINYPSTDHNYHPYSNLCPITGHDGFTRTGTGKNLFNGTIINGQVMSDGSFVGSWQRITNAIRSGSYLSDLFLKAGTYTLDIDGLDYCSAMTKDKNGNIIDNFATSWNDLPFTFTTTKDALFIFTGRKNNNPNLTPSDYFPQIVVGDSVGTYESPNIHSYETEFPIVSANKWDGEWEVGEIDSNGDNKVNASRSRSTNYIPVKPSTQYYHVGIYMAIVCYDANKGYISQIGGFYSDRAFTTPANCYFVRFFINSPTMPEGVAINYPATVTYYNPYSNVAYGCHFSNNGNGTGNLTVDMVGVDLGSLSWAKSSSGNKFYATVAPNYKKQSNITMLCSYYKFDGYGSSGARGYYGENGTIRYFYSASQQSRELYVHDESFSDASALQTALDGQMIVYPLETPQTYTLPLDIIQSLIGQNHVWVDNADEVSVEYWGH